MIPINVGDFAWGVEAAQRLYGVGFNKVNNAGQRYRDFVEDIRLLAINLDLISNIVRQAQIQTTTFNPISRPVPAAHQVLGNFRETLSDCERLLDDQRYFTKHDGFVTNISFYYQTDPEVQVLRDRLALHNIKLSISLKILDSLVIYLRAKRLDTNCSSQILGDRFIQICDPTNAILSALEQLGRQIRGEEEHYEVPNEPLGTVAIPQELEDGFSVFSQGLFPDLSAIPLDRGVDTAVFYFNRATKTPDQLVQSEIKYLISIINITMAIWLIRAVKAGQYYQNATRYWSPNKVEQLMSRWGMTIERFFYKLEENLHEAFRNLLGPHLLLPPTPDLLEIFERERIVWQGGPVKTPKPENNSSDLGTEIMSARLMSSDLSYTQNLQLYRQTEKCFSLLLVKAALSEGRDKETIDSYDLENVQIIPTYAMRTWTHPPTDPQTIRFRTNSNSPIYRNLEFHQIKDMFQFQHAVTGYKVVHDDARVLATSQESKFLGGTKRQDLCRLQIWTASPSKDDASIATKALSPVPLSTASLVSPQTSSVSITTSEPRSKPSTFTFSAISSGRNKSSSSAFSTCSDLPMSPKSGVSVGEAVVFAPPITPSVVLFAHKDPEIGGGGEMSRSFLIIDVNPDVICEEESIESGHAHAPSYRCVLERTGSYLPARRSSETDDPNKWDLAVAGLHKRQAGTQAVKKLKYVIIEFDTQINLSQFITKFKQVQDLAKLRLAQFLQATG